MPRKVSFNPDALMKQAVDVMKNSKTESRNDGKMVPYVGAILWKPDGSIDTAHRGELRDGDHAEFTLLERKHGHESLDGAVVFATLEPCTPDSRTPPKIGCSRRIILARINKAYIGIEDPDPLVAGKGIRYLQENGVDVVMFPRELQEEIREVNAEFLEQAFQRAKEAADLDTAPKLSKMEEAESKLTVADDFSIQSLKDFASAIEAPEEVISTAFANRLIRMGLMEKMEDGVQPSGYGLILFGHAPEEVHHQVRLLATINYPDGSEETKDFGGPLVQIPANVANWLSDKLPNVDDRSEMHRKKVSPLPMEVLREGVVNALVHRDYDNESAKIQLIITPDQIQIKSPGGPMPPITLEQLNAFRAPMLSRNPRIQYVFNRLRLSEERGLGMKTLKQLQRKHGLPLPRYSFDDPYLVLTIYRHAEANRPFGRDGQPLKLTETEMTVWQLIRAKGESFKTSELMADIQADRRTVLRILGRFVDEGLLESPGTGRGARYKVLK